VPDHWFQPSIKAQREYITNIYQTLEPEKFKKIVDHSLKARGIGCEDDRKQKF
jgi:hypothetical protein